MFENMRLGDHTVVVNLIVTKMGKNLKFWPDENDIVAKALELLTELTLSTVKYLASHHTQEEFPFWLLENMYGMDGCRYCHHEHERRYRCSRGDAIASPIVLSNTWHTRISLEIIFGSVVGDVSGSRGREDAKLPIPEGSYIEPTQREIVDSILRYDVSCGEVRTYSLCKGV